jgi:D-alanyl-D-alanine carboxypeptidase
MSTCQRAFAVFLTLIVSLVPELAHGNDRLGEFTRTNAGTPPHNARLQSLLEAAARDGLPGVSLRVKGPGVDFHGAAGVADLSTGEPLTTNHAMYVASLGKTFTAAVALQLCDEGRLALEAPITTWLPAELTTLIPFSGTITLRHLLSHTAGLIDYMNDDKAWRSDFVRDPQRQWTHSDVIPYLYDKPLLFEPGTDYYYSNSNYILLGAIIEQVAAQPLHAVIRKRILAPLGLQHTFNGQDTVTSEKHAHGYIKRHNRIIDTYPWYSHYALADSGIHSTPAELALFLKSLFTTEEILSETMRTRMTHVAKSGRVSSGYGMGIYVQQEPWGPGRWYTHDGVDPGYQADMMYLPDIDLTIVLCANASLGKADLIYARLIKAVVQAALDAVQEIRR